MRIEYSNRYLKAASRLSAKIIDLADKKETLFQEQPFHPSLHTHKLHGKEKEAWAFWIDYVYRIKFLFLDEGVVLFFGVGTHEIYD